MVLTLAVLKMLDQRLLGETDLIVTTTGNTNVCDAAMLRALKNGAVVCNIGHFDTEIDTAWMRANWQWEEVKAAGAQDLSCCPRCAG